MLRQDVASRRCSFASASSCRSASPFAQIDIADRTLRRRPVSARIWRRRHSIPRTSTSRRSASSGRTRFRVRSMRSRSMCATSRCRAGHAQRALRRDDERHASTRSTPIRPTTRRCFRSISRAKCRASSPSASSTSLGFNDNIIGNIGIESTPVIDLSTNTMYLVARTETTDSGAVRHDRTRRSSSACMRST